MEGFTMKTKKIMEVNKKEVIKKLYDNGYTNDYENDVIIDALERRSAELYTKSQCKGFKLFYPNAEIECRGSHEYIIKRI